MQRATAARGDGLALRVGLDAGEPIADGDDLYGTPVIVASRLCDAAGDGEILVSDVVRQVAGPALRRPDAARRARCACAGIGERGRRRPGRLAGRRRTGAPAPAERARRPGAPDHASLIADDQRLLRTGFRVILDAEPDITRRRRGGRRARRGRRASGGAAPTSCSWTSACPSSTACRRPSRSSPTPSSTTAVRDAHDVRRSTSTSTRRCASARAASC